MPKRYSQSDVEQALQAAGLGAGDTVFVTTSLGLLGVAEGAETLEDLNHLHLRALQNVVGEKGTLIVPTYSYTFGGSTATEYATFDPRTTSARIGPFPDFFRQQPGVIRSTDPMMSVAGLGPAAPALFYNLPPTSYGADSIFARLTNTAAKCCSIGLGPNWMPFIHHADWLAKAPFRYDKLFHGVLAQDGETRETAWVYSVPLLSKESEANGHVVGGMATAAGIWKFAELGRARVYVCSYREYFDFTMQKLRENPWATAFGPPGDPVALEELRVPKRKVSLNEMATLREAFAVLGDVNRPDVSDMVDYALEALARDLSIKTHRYRTGENHFDWIIPEKWSVSRAELRDQSGTVIWSLSDGEDRVYTNSLSAKKSVDKITLKKHVSIGEHTRPQVNVVRNRNWGFCCTQAEWQRLPEGPFDVEIESNFSFGEMPVGEYIVKGKGVKKKIVIASLARSDLQSAYAAYQWAKELERNGTPEESYHFLWISGPAGFAAWLNTHRDIIGAIAAIVEVRDSTTPWQQTPQEIEMTDAFYLTPGGNPLAKECVVDLGLPVFVI
jgi:aminoglycoside N3'-acetyltransferase